MILQTKELNASKIKQRTYYLHNMRVAYQMSRSCGKGRVASVVMVTVAVLTNFFYGPFDPTKGQK